MKKIKKGNNTFKFERATETARAIVGGDGASDPDPGFRRYAAGFQVLQMHFKSVEHAVRSRPDWPAVCQAVADAQCGLSTEELLDGLLLAVQQHGGGVDEPIPSPTVPPDPAMASPLDTTKLLEELGRWAQFARENVPVPNDCPFSWDVNNASAAEITKIRQLKGGAFSLNLTPEAHCALCRNLDEILRAGKVFRRFLFEQERGGSTATALPDSR